MFIFLCILYDDLTFENALFGNFLLHILVASGNIHIIK